MDGSFTNTNDMEKIYELRKDIRTPNRYIRAGERRTKEEWSKEFPNAFTLELKEWFLDLSSIGSERHVRSQARKVVDEVFHSHDLHSVSYKMAAVVAIERYVKLTAETKKGKKK